MGTQRRCRRSLRRISRIRAVSGGDIVQRSELLLCSHVPCAGGEAVHGGVSGVYQFYMVIFIPAFREFHEYQGHAHPALTGMWGAQSASILSALLLVTADTVIRSHRHVGSTTASTTTASIIVAFSEAYIQIIKNGVRTYTHDITLQVFFSSTLHRQSAAGSHSLQAFSFFGSTVLYGGLREG